MAMPGHQKVKEIFNAALRQEPAERLEFLDKACGADKALRGEVESLLTSDENASSFLESPLIGELAETLIPQAPQFSNGQQFGQYEIIELIGVGGMGEVYLALDNALNRKVALKLMPASLISDRENLKRFEREAFAVSSLNHPNILTIYAIGELGSTHFLSTEYVDGSALSKHCAVEDLLELPEILEIGSQVSSALSAAHEAGIIHRDIKPENIMVRKDGFIKVLDFGLAKLADKQRPDEGEGESASPLMVNTSKGIVMGTAPYMSPEQARGSKTDERTDVWSLGVVLYELVSGRKPFTGETPADVVAEIVAKDPKPINELVPNLPLEVERIVQKALVKDRDKRYQTADELRKDLESVKHKIEFEDEFGSSAATNRKPGRISSEQSGVEVTRDQVDNPTLSTEYLFAQIKSHKTFFLSIIPALLVGAIAIGYLWVFSTATPVLTDKDVILLIDFENKTGEEIFDGTLRQGLVIQLTQSPFLSIFPDSEVYETLKLMKRDPEETITPQMARDICQRRGLKAYIAGAISKLGNHYVVGIEAVNAGTGEIITITQAEAETQEKVTGALSKAATEMREKLGEPLALIRRYDKSLPEVTTESLVALKAYSMGKEMRSRNKNERAIALYKRALEIDPEFASAYLALSEIHINWGQRELTKRNVIKAHELRENVSEREKLFIDYYYYEGVLQDIPKMIESMEIGKLMYPRDEEIRIAIVGGYFKIGKFDQVISETAELLDLNPKALQGNPKAEAALDYLTRAFIHLNRFTEAKEAIRKFRRDPTTLNHRLYEIAVAENDTEAIQGQIETLEKENKGLLALELGLTAGYHGKMRESRKLFSQVTDREGNQVPWYVMVQMWEAASYDQCGQVREFANEILPLPSETQLYEDSATTAYSLVRCGEISRAQPLIDKLTNENPTATLVNMLWLPVIKAEIELQRGNPEEAVRILKPTRRFEAAGLFFPQSIRGRAFLRLKENEKARMEFQDILDHRGQVILSAFYPLAQLGKARAMKDKREYEKFFEMWREADSDLPALVNARNEYEKLN